MQGVVIPFIMWLSVLALRGYPRSWRGVPEWLSSIGDSGNPQMSQKPTSRSPASRRCSCVGFAEMILFLVVAGGCGSNDNLDRQAISGIVTLDGQLLSDGAIHMEPATNQSGTAVGATIRRGAFALTRDQGPVPGSYRVRIYASSGIQTPPGKGQSEHSRRPMVERLPDIYNVRTELRADVTARGANRFRFDLHSVGRDHST
jgi:hypothetical protein